MLKDLLSAPVALVFMLGGPITYILNAIDTWQSNASVAVKLLMTLTLDVILAAIWPITWILWIVWEVSGSETPLSTVLGF